MFRHTCALAAAFALSLSAVACVAPTEQPDDSAAEQSESDLVSTSAYFETFEGLDGRFYFNLTAANGESVLRSQGYTRLASAQGGVASVLANGNDKRNFEVKQASNGDHYFNLLAGNGEVIGTSELYASKANAERGARTVRALVRLSREATQGAPQRETFELFDGEDGKAYFHLRAGNGEIMLSSQGYTSSQSAKTGIASVLANGRDDASYEVFATEDERYAFRLVAKNGEVIARGQSYASKGNADRAVTRLTAILARPVKTIQP
ncbi:MAG: hypothetical protein JWP97_418 [Labilithrix sp.]|nr:hypothetical protein [Labilithrix sp.]